MHTFVPKEDGKPMMLDKETFKEAWNSGYMKDIRKKMMNGEAVTGCETCYEQEKVGKRSYRQSHNEEWSKETGSKVFGKFSGAFSWKMTLWLISHRLTWIYALETYVI
jgi:hypothetical protein